MAVTDNGVGVPEGQHDHIFEMFHRGKNHNGPGTGIGLALCKQIVERACGSIWLDAPGPDEPPATTAGSVFRFTLPAAGRSPT